MAVEDATQSTRTDAWGYRGPARPLLSFLRPFLCSLHSLLVSTNIDHRLTDKRPYQMQCGQMCDYVPGNRLQSDGGWGNGQFNLTCANGATASLVTAGSMLSTPNQNIPFGKYVNMTFKLPPECFSGCKVCAPGTFGPSAVSFDQ